MTFNVQCLPLIAGVLDGTISVPGAVIGLFPSTDSDAIARAEGVCADLLAIPPAERPHVIALNEAFNEDAREVFLNELSGTWPHVIKSVHEGDLEEDSGLMVFSSLPFYSINGSDRLEMFYSTDAGDDSWASKAAVLVQVDLPAEVTTLVFTHLQAAYNSDDQHRDVRADQLYEVLKLVDQALGGNRDDWRNVIVAGDLNIRGDAGSTADEWFATFDSAQSEFGTRFADGWVEMRPPGVGSDLDPGYSHRGRHNQVEQRLDYVCHVKRNDNEMIVPHAMRVGHKAVSDHYALEALIQFEAPHCQPQRAVDLLATGPMVGNPVPGQPVGSLAWNVWADIPAEDGRFWIWIREPGTYSFFAPPALSYQVFAESDISHPLDAYASIHATALPPSVAVAFHEFERRLDPEGGTFVHRDPMLLCLKSSSGQPISNLPFVVFQHRGDTPATALALPPHHDLAVPYPAGQPLGDNDECWFRVQPRETLIGKERSETIELRMQGWDSSRLSIVDAALNPSAKTSGTGTLQHAYQASARDDFFVMVQRDGIDQVGQVIRWSTPVCYLRLDEGIHIHVNNESGPDWPGADEPYLELSLDSEHLLTTEWDDADTGEDWPNLTKVIWDAITARGWTHRSVGLSESIDIVLEDPDRPLGAAHGIASTPIGLLSPGEPARAKRVTSVNVFDTISNGTYTFTCTLTRDP